MIEYKNLKLDVINGNLDEKIKKIFGPNTSFEILSRSIDARNKKNIFYVYDLKIDVPFAKYSHLKNVKEYVIKEKEFNITGDTVMKMNPIVVGTGPAGLFSAYFLAKFGYKPIIIERGKRVDERKADVEKFWQEGILNPNSNVQFGEGGAGTFSDGKLNTLIKDQDNLKRLVLSTFVENGADKEIMYDYKPHIGTDELFKIIKNMREKIVKWGGTYYFEYTLNDIIKENNHIVAVKLNDNKIIKCNVLILAIGHSARDTFKMLRSCGLNMENKPFAIGLRAIHNQDMINKSQYGEKYMSYLPAASYKLTYKSSCNKGVYTFCMCPGGYVINASSGNGQAVCNGMSYSDRSSKTANSAIIVTVDENDYGTELFAGINYQERLEKLAYDLGNGKLPISLLKDYENNTISSKIGNVIPNIKGEYIFTDLNKLFSDNINESIKEAFPHFDQKIKGFNSPDTILVGIESRSSSPVRIIRNDDMESNIKGIYPIGEGAGYAGGITSAAMDGIKAFEKIIAKFKP